MSIDVVHDKVGSYAMWDAADRYERHTVRVMEDYLLGRREARYPVLACRNSVQVMKSQYGFRMFTVVVEMPSEDAWKIVGWEALRNWY